MDATVSLVQSEQTNLLLSDKGEQGDTEKRDQR